MGEINLQPQYLKDSNGNRIAPITTIEAVKLTDDLNLTDVLDDFGASGDMHKSGFVPDPGSTSGNSKALYEDGTWKDTYTKTESDNKYATKTDISSLATVAISGSYNDLSDKPTISAAQVNSDWNASSGVAEILHKPNIPTKMSDLTNDAGYTTNTGTITSVKMNGSTIASSGEADLGTVITSHQDISGKANKSEMSVIDGTGTDADKTTITLKSGTSATVLKSHQSLSSKQDTIDSSHKLSADLVDDTNTTHKFVTTSEKSTWNGKQDAITDLTTIRSGAAAGATAYQKPQGGIPSTDMSQGVQTSLGKADTSLQPTQQTLTDAQKQQVRNNIGAAGTGDVPTLPDNVSYFSNDGGEGIIPTDGIRGEEIVASATININSEVVTFITGEVGSNTNITLTVPNDALWHVWDIFLTTAADGGATIVVPTGATLHVPSGYSIASGKTYEIRVIGKGLNYYLTYGEFA